jgi:hypothetical protein
MAADPALTKITAKTAGEVCQLYALVEELKPIASQPVSPLQFLDWVLGQEDKPKDAVEFLARALPAREAVWWGSLCVLLVGPPLSPKQQTALGWAALWACSPSDTNRAAAEKAAKDAEGSPAGYLAMAAGAVPAQKPDEPSPPVPLTANCVAAALHVLAASVRPAKEIAPAYRRCVAVGIGVAQGKHVPAAPPAAGRPPASRPGQSPAAAGRRF